MWLLCKGKFRVSAGVCLLLGWFILVNGWYPAGLVLSAAALHELGHYAALRLLGARLSALRISVFGAEMTAGGTTLSYGGELAAVLAGPAVNLLAGIALAQAGYPAAAGAHLVLCAFNLLPVRPLDGGRALYLLISWAAGPAAGETVCRWAGGCTALALATALVWLMVRSGGSLWLLPAAAGLCMAALRELFGERRSFL